MSERHTQREVKAYFLKDDRVIYRFHDMEAAVRRGFVDPTDKQSIVAFLVGRVARRLRKLRSHIAGLGFQTSDLVRIMAIKRELEFLGTCTAMSFADELRTGIGVCLEDEEAKDLDANLTSYEVSCEALNDALSIDTIVV